MTVAVMTMVGSVAFFFIGYTVVVREVAWMVLYSFSEGTNPRN